MPDPIKAYVSQSLFGLTLTASTVHPAFALIRRLPRDLWIGPVPGTGNREYIVALDARTIPTLRQIYRLANTEFSPDAIAALQALSGRKSAPQARPRVDTAPQVSASLRALQPTLDRTGASGAGASIPQTTDANSFEGTAP